MTVLAVVLIFAAGFSGEPTPDEAPAQAEVATPSSESPTESAPSAEPTPSEPTKVDVPALVGTPRDEAEELLVAAGLTVKTIVRVPSAEARGTVIRQGKRAGTPLLPGSAIKLLVAAPYPKVPVVGGRSEAEARRILREAGFRVRVTSEERTSGADGSILRQSPRAGRRVAPNAFIDVVVLDLVAPAPEPSEPPEDCTSGYDPCLAPMTDYDCAGGEGDGPGYIDGPVYIEGSDPYELDNDGDGVACET
ncbi:PASTA domain-containing protein [uncultured Nocardioides sp.]|uniref:PASTA domain-containing protein n=1 Tax=uncultured Nocardioides sp. TaxID=198441 RepID=UPI0026144B58|nr:PASTA domain-containing protein [uncultured Nocardioides sp.]